MEKRIPTGITGYDSILRGGYIEGSFNLVAGECGAGKTIFALCYTINGADRYGDNALFVTLEESRANILKNMPAKLKETFERNTDKITIVDLSVIRKLTTVFEEKTGFSSIVDVDVLIESLRKWITEKKIKRVAIDGLAVMSIRYPQESEMRSAIFRISSSLKELGVTAMITEESERDVVAKKFGVKEFVADSITHLRYDNGLRTIEVLKLRGSDFLPGESGFVINDEGIEVFPRLMPETKASASDKRVPTGISGLDKMLGGGFFRGDVILVSGSAGAGKTIMGLQFVSEGCRSNERGLIVSFEENPAQLKRNARAVGIPLEKYEKEKLLEIMYSPYPGTNIHMLLHQIISRLPMVERIFIDTVNHFESAMPREELRNVLVSFTSMAKKHGVSVMFSAESDELMGTSRLMASNVSYVVDTILVLRHVEIGSEMRKAINLLKVRGTQHIKDIREYEITNKGIVIKDKFQNVEGVFSGSARVAARKLEKFFD
ncbi:MAG: AAA family ATPase [Thermoplasmata archaeon]|nr:AAA family ATPase [Thermoplasmata archaeon]